MENQLQIKKIENLSDLELLIRGDIVEILIAPPFRRNYTMVYEGENKRDNSLYFTGRTDAGSPLLISTWKILKSKISIDENGKLILNRSDINKTDYFPYTSHSGYQEKDIFLTKFGLM